MGGHVIAYLMCILALPLFSFACPSGSNETYCPERNGCVSAGQNCSDGVISSCMNETIPCDKHGTVHCVDVRNHTCGNFSCNSTQRYCPEHKKCINLNESCCTQYEEACGNVIEYATFFKPHQNPLTMVCNLLSSAANFSLNYSMIKYENAFKKKPCENNTHFCPLSFGCIPMNESCDPTQAHTKDDSFKYFDAECGRFNKTFCPLMMNCIPQGEHCSYKKLFDWYARGNMSVDPFGNACPVNESFCLFTFGCHQTCNVAAVMGNMSCGGKPWHILCPETLECVANKTLCSSTVGDFTNVTDSTSSGWLDMCKRRHVITGTFWQKYRECKPYEYKCRGQKEEKKFCELSPGELCGRLHRYNETGWLFDKLNDTGASVAVWLEGCNVTVNKTHLDWCNITRMPWNKSCEFPKLCHDLRAEFATKEDFAKINSTILLGVCNVTVNMTVLEMCNISMPEHRNKSCQIHYLCHGLRAEFDSPDDFTKMNSTISVDECNVTVNMTVLEMCDISMPKHRNKSCQIPYLCHGLRAEFDSPDDFTKMNSTISVDECNVTVNMTVLKMCNISMPKHRNKSCQIPYLCHGLRAEFDSPDDFTKMNSTISVDECNVTVNMTVLKMCNISMPEHRNKSCQIHYLCHGLRAEFDSPDDFTKMNSTISVDECNVTVNMTVLKMCNISMPEHRNKSCQIHYLCHGLRAEFDNPDDFTKMNSTISVDECNVAVNMTVLKMCNISMPEHRNKSCQIYHLCHGLRAEFDSPDDFTKMNSTISVGECNVTVNMTVLKMCNISMPKHRNKSCQIYNLCHGLRAEFDSPDDFAKVNRTIPVGECNVTVNMTILQMCNISMPEKKRSCEIHKLCHHLRGEFDSEDDYAKLNRTIPVGECNVTVNMTVLWICNITIPRNRSSDFRYHTFFNGFKISDSIEKGTTFIAVRGVDASQYGTWKYKNAMDWIPLGAVSPSKALVLEVSVYLRFIPHDPCWYGLAMLKYTPVKTGSTGDFVDVSSTPEDPRYTLALLKPPPRPIANVFRLVDPIYSSQEDQETAGIKVGDKIVMNVSCSMLINGISSNHSAYLKEDVLEDYNNALMFLKSIGPAIAIVGVGNASEGVWQIGRQDLSSAKITSPVVVRLSDVLRFVPARNVHGNFKIKFVPIMYSNYSSGSVKKPYLDAPAPIAHALKGVMSVKKTSKAVRYFLESVLREMASNGTTYSLKNFNRVIDGISGSSGNKTEAKNISTMAFARVWSSMPHRLPGLPRVLNSHGGFAILDNPNISEFRVVVTPTNDQPVVTQYQIKLPAIANNITSYPNVGKTVQAIVTSTSNKGSLLTTDIDQDARGIAVVQALNTSIGSWYYKNTSTWVQLIVDNPSYNDRFVGVVKAFLLEPGYTIRFRMHREDIMWSNLEARESAKIIFLAWDMSDGRTVGRYNVSRPSGKSSAYSARSVLAVVERYGCDGRLGSKGKWDRCGKCGGDGTTCMGCDGKLNSGAKIDGCGNCTGGTTNLTFNFMKDCAKQCGLSFNDSCGVCQLKSNVRNVTDCSGKCFGRARTNKCGHCAGGTTGKPKTYGEDECGVCGGDNSSCTDCAGVIKGGKRVDTCGQCLLASDSRFDNECVLLKKNVPESGPSSGGVVVRMYGAGLKDKTSVACELVNRADNNTKIAISSSSLVSFNNVRVISFRAPPVAAGNYKISCKFGNLANIYEVNDTSFLVYNKSSIDYTSVSPAAAFIGSALVTSITGVGFVNTTDLACISHKGHVFPATFIDSTNVSCSIPAFQKSTRLHLALSFSRADRVFGAKNVSFVIFAETPRPQSAKFIDSLQGILVTFDKPCRPKVKSENCSLFFDASDVVKFGARSRCIFRTPINMLIALRGNVTIVPQNSITFTLTSVLRKFQELTEVPNVANHTLSVRPATNPAVPKALLSGRPVLGLCASFKLSGGQSHGGGGRRLRFFWSVGWDDPNDANIDANATADLASISSYLASVNGTSERQHEWRAPTIVVGLAYRFTLRVENFLGLISKEESFVVRRQNKQLPGLTLGAERKTMKAALGRTLEAKIKLSRCLPAGYKPKVLFAWEIDAVGINLGVVNQPRLRIAPRTLQGGKTYELTLTATMESDSSLSTTAKIYLTVQSSPLRAIIQGGDVLVVGESDTISLDASTSNDPDGSSETATYEWLCYDSSGFPCFEPDPSKQGQERRMVIPSGVKASIDVATKLKTNANYKITLKYSKGSREDKASIDVKVKSGTPPRVFIQPLISSQINPNERLIITAQITSRKTVTGTWSCVEETGFGYISLEDHGVLFAPRTKTFVKGSRSEAVTPMDLAIKKDQLEYGVKYKFRLTAQHGSGNSSGFSDIVVATNAAPSQGTLKINPPSGFFGNTSFTFSADEGWSDSSDSLPLTYTFGYWIRNDRTGRMREVLLNFPVEEYTLDFDLLPQGYENNILQVFVDVSDIYGAVTRQTADAVVRPADMQASALSELTNDVDSDFESGDLANGIARANAVAGALSGSGSSDANRTKALQVFKNTVTNKVLSAVVDGSVQDESAKDVVRGCLLQMTSGCKPNCNSAGVARGLAKMEGVSQSSSSRRKRRAVEENNIVAKTGDQVSTVLQIFDNVITADDYSQSSTTAKADLLSTIASAEKSLCKGLATGGSAELAKSNLTVIRAVKDPFTAVDGVFLEVSSSQLPEYIDATVTFRLTTWLQERYDSWNCTTDEICTGTCIASAQFKDDLLIQHDPSEKNLTRLSDVASIRFYNPETLDEVPITGLSSPVAIRFPIKNAESYENYTKECRVWNDGSKEWQLSGCMGYRTINTSIIECSCTRLGHIAVFMGDKANPTTPAATTQPATPATTPDEAKMVEFAFIANYSDVITGNLTKSVFIDHLRPYIANRLNISIARISKMDIPSGSIIVMQFLILPANGTNEATANATAFLLQKLVQNNDVNFTLPFTNKIIYVNTNSFKIISTPQPTTIVVRTTIPTADGDDDGLSTTNIVIIAVVCSLVFLVIVVAVVYYIVKVRPTTGGKVSPKGSHIQLDEQRNNQDQGLNNNAADFDEKAF